MVTEKTRGAGARTGRSYCLSLSRSYADVMSTTEGGTLGEHIDLTVHRGAGPQWRFLSSTQCVR